VPSAALAPAIWQAYATYQNNPLLFPSSVSHRRVLREHHERRSAAARLVLDPALNDGLCAGFGSGGTLTALAISSHIGNDFLETLTSMFNPLPAIALLPLALIWFGMGNASLVFVLVHSVLWPVFTEHLLGFMSVSPTMRMVGRTTV